MDEQVEKQAKVTIKSLQERIAALEADFAARYEQQLSQLSQLEQKHGLLLKAHQQLEQDFQAYKNTHPLKKLLKQK